VRLLVDTHIFIWSDRRPAAIPRAVMAALRDDRNEIVLSVVSVWEIALKRAAGKLDFAAQISESAERMGYSLMPITAAHAEHAGGMPRLHGDPFDRLIVAQAYLEGLVLATSDLALARYGVPILGAD
jgi:PIN domain nuclease of toxin-antitoxin system